MIGENAVSTNRNSFFLLATLLLSVAIAIAQQPKPPDVVVLKGAPMGAVKFEHTKHVSNGFKCDSCHHASKPEKPSTDRFQKCSTCHTKIATAPMKTKYQAAFHDPAATKGLCIDCHKTDAKAKDKALTKCAGCHRKENT
jgi:hypothetical protein